MHALRIETASFLCQFENFIFEVKRKNKMYREQIKRYSGKPDL